MPTSFIPLACDGCFTGAPAIISLGILILTLIGSIFVLLASNFGARVGYLITMVSLAAFMVFFSLLWMIGGPGTTTGTGPRGREPAWIPFHADSAVADEFRDVVDNFPNEWDIPDHSKTKTYPGNIDGNGEIQTASSAIKAALANEAKVQGLDGTKATDWAFRQPGIKPTTDEEAALPLATFGFFQRGDGPLLFGITIPATEDHREVTVFAYRDEGLVFLYALYFLIVSTLLFALHLWLLTRHELRQKAKDEALESSTVSA